MVDRSMLPEQATGFVFEQPDSSALLQCMRRALLFFYEYPEEFTAMQKRAMATRFTWQAAAEDYLALYNSAMQ